MLTWPASIIGSISAGLCYTIAYTLRWLGFESLSDWSILVLECIYQGLVSWYDDMSNDFVAILDDISQGCEYMSTWPGFTVRSISAVSGGLGSSLNAVAARVSGWSLSTMVTYSVLFLGLVVILVLVYRPQRYFSPAWARRETTLAVQARAVRTLSPQPMGPVIAEPTGTLTSSGREKKKLSRGQRRRARAKAAKAAAQATATASSPSSALAWTAAGLPPARPSASEGAEEQGKEEEGTREEEEEEEQQTAATTTTITTSPTTAQEKEALSRPAAGLIAPALPIPIEPAAPISRTTLFLYLVLVFLALPLSVPQLVFKIAVSVYLSPSWLSPFVASIRRHFGALLHVLCLLQPSTVVLGTGKSTIGMFPIALFIGLSGCATARFSCYPSSASLPLVVWLVSASLLVWYTLLTPTYLPTTMGGMLHKYLGPSCLTIDKHIMEEAVEEAAATLAQEPTLEERIDSILAHHPSYLQEIGNGSFGITQAFDFSAYNGIGALTSSMDNINKQQEYEKIEWAARMAAVEDPTLASQPLWFTWGLVAWCIMCYATYVGYRFWEKHNI